MTADMRPRDPEQTFTATVDQLLARVGELERLVSTGSPGVPAGTVWAFVGSTAPAGWLLLDGSTIAAADRKYPALWAVLPAGMKSGTSLVLLDCRGHVLAGAGGSVYTLGALAGSMSTAIAAGNLPAHTHSMSHTHSGSTGGRTSAHAHNQAGYNLLQRGAWNGTQWDVTFTNNGVMSVIELNNAETSDHAHNFTTGGPSVADTGNGPGSGAALTTAPAALGVNFILKAH